MCLHTLIFDNRIALVFNFKPFVCCFFFLSKKRVMNISCVLFVTNDSQALTAVHTLTDEPLYCTLKKLTCHDAVLDRLE